MLRSSLALGLVLLSCGEPAAVPVPAAPPAVPVTPAVPAAPVEPAPAAEPAVTPPAAQVVVRGRVLGHDGAPLPRAQVRLVTPGESAPRIVDAAPDGRFEITGGPGLVEASFGGAGHVATRLALLLEGTAVELTVKLATHAAPEPGAAVTAMVWRTPDGEVEEVRMQADANGLWFAELDLPAGEVRYQVSGHVGAHSTHGTRSDALEPDGEGGFKSVLRTAGGKARLELDPAAFSPFGRPGSVEFSDPAGVTARIAELAQRRAALDEAAMKAGEHAKPGGQAAFMAELAALAVGDAPAAVRRAALVLAFSFPPAEGPDTAVLARRALEEVGPTDPLWGLHRRALARAITATGAPDEFAALREAAIDGHPDPELGASLLLPELERLSAAHDEAGARRVYARLQMPRFASTMHRLMAAQFDPDGPLRPGKKLPAAVFDVLDPLAGAPTTIDLSAPRGRPVLVDIWATWCEPCIEEMGALHRLHAEQRRGPQGLEIVGVSVDDDPAAVREFRRGKWKLPWLNVVVPADRSESFLSSLGIIGVPVLVLLDEHGTIVDSSPGLELAQVPALLKKLRETSAAPGSAPAAAPAR